LPYYIEVEPVSSSRSDGTCNSRFRVISVRSPIKSAKLAENVTLKAGGRVHDSIFPSTACSVWNASLDVCDTVELIGKVRTRMRGQKLGTMGNTFRKVLMQSRDFVEGPQFLEQNISDSIRSGSALNGAAKFGFFYGQFGSFGSFHVHISSVHCRGCGLRPLRAYKGRFQIDQQENVMRSDSPPCSPCSTSRLSTLLVFVRCFIRLLASLHQHTFIIILFVGIISSE